MWIHAENPEIGIGADFIAHFANVPFESNLISIKHNYTAENIKM